MHDAETGAPQPPPIKERIKLVCAGGLFVRDSKFYDTFIHQLKQARDAFEPVRLLDPPSLGALALGEEAEELQSIPAH